MRTVLQQIESMQNPLPSLLDGDAHLALISFRPIVHAISVHSLMPMVVTRLMYSNRFCFLLCFLCKGVSHERALGG